MNNVAPFDFTAYKRRRFAWSYSALSNFETCPRKYAEMSLWKRHIDEGGEGSDWGSSVHKAFSRRLRHKEPLPLGMRHHEGFLALLETKPGKLYDEQKMALNEKLEPVDFFAKDAWFRSIIDCGLHHPTDTMRIFDWKTGRVREDDAQLASQAAMIFYQMPEIQQVGACFVWIKDQSLTLRSFQRKDLPEIWASLMPRVQRLKLAWENTTFEPRPGFLCRKYCPVTTCPHHGK